MSVVIPFSVISFPGRAPHQRPHANKTVSAYFWVLWFLIDQMIFKTTPGFASIQELKLERRLDLVIIVAVARGMMERA